MLKPLGHRVLVKVDKVEEKIGSFYLPQKEVQKERNGKEEGVLMDIGSTAFQNLGDGTPWAAIGDKVVFARYGGYRIEDNGDHYVILNDEDLIGKRD